MSIAAFDAGPPVTLPAVTAAQMAEVDRIMVQDLGIALIQMMENGGRHLADLTIARWQPERVVVLSGPGGNGGGGLVAARHLANRGSDVEVVLSDVGRLAAVPAHQRTVLDAMGVPVHDMTGVPMHDMTGVPMHDTQQLSVPLPELLADAVVIDALLGYSLDGDPREPAAGLIRAVEAVDVPVVALDLPSGLEATSGRVGDPCITADATLTLALPKTGMVAGAAQVGELYVADISVPPSAYEALGITITSPFRDVGIRRVEITA